MSFISKTVGKAAQILGRTYDYATPGAGTSRLTQAGRKAVQASSTPKAAPIDVNKAVGYINGHPYNAGGDFLDGYNPNQQQQAAPPSVPNTGAYDGSNGSGGTTAANDYDPNVDPALVAAARNRASGLMDAFRQAFAAVIGKIDALAGEKKQQVGDSYDKQKTSLTNNYNSTAQGIDQAEAARGTYNSSYRAAQQGTAQNAFNDAYSGLNTSEANDLADIGKWAETSKATAQAATPTYNVNDYGQVSDLLNIQQAIQQAVGQLGISGAGLGTTASNTAALNAITPKTETGSTALKSQLDKLANTNANSDAKRAIATQIVNDSGEDPNQWLDYFDRVSKTGSQTA